MKNSSRESWRKWIVWFCTVLVFNSIMPNEAGAMQETQFSVSAAEVTRERRVIHFTSGETLYLDSEEEEEEREEPAFRDKAKLSIKNLPTRVGRLSLLVLDFLGEKFAGVFGLNDAKYQYAIDQHRRGKKAICSDDPGSTPLSPELSRSCYGATEDTRPGDLSLSEDQCGDKGRLNGGYQAEDSHLE